MDRIRLVEKPVVLKMYDAHGPTVGLLQKHWDKRLWVYMPTINQSQADRLAAKLENAKSIDPNLWIIADSWMYNTVASLV